MKQVLQNLKSGALMIEEVPTPLVKSGHLLIETTCSLISAGTERMVVDFGRANLVEKALQKPDKVKQVLQKAKTDGVAATMDAVNARLDQPIALGYSNVGRVIAVGKGVEGFKPGDRVVSNGKHAEVVSVPKNLCAKIPDNVTDDQAAFTVLSSIGLQGIRLLNPTLGEYVCVMGLGLIGLIATQILKANGCRVIGFDFDPNRVALARKFGAEAHDLSTGIDPVKKALEYTGQQGIDAVLITAATRSHDVIAQAAQMCRKRGRVVLTGVIGLNLDRSDFYDKEISFQVSCSYGPGRYDPFYEDNGNDYPVGFVRWTEQRNFEAVLHLFAAKSLNINPLLTKRVALEDAEQAYDALSDSSHIGMIIDYPAAKEAQGEQRLEQTTVTVRRPAADLPSKTEEQAVIGIIGAGGFTVGKVLPCLTKTKARLKWIASAQGVSSGHAAKKFGIEKNTTDYSLILGDPEVNAVVITTQHGSHAKFVCEALKAGKHVFVEKPLCLTREELHDIQKAYDKACEEEGVEKILMVGFNRRFSPLTQIMKQQLQNRQAPLSMIFTANVGFIPADHWVHDPKAGGGRILGEACHFVDYLTYLTGSQITDVQATGLTPSGTHDTAMINLTFADGSIGQVNYLANGNKAYPKEQCQVFCDGKILNLDNFRILDGYGFTKFKKKKLWRQDKGHDDGFAAFVDAVTNGKKPPVSLEDIFSVTDKTLTAWEQLTGLTPELSESAQEKIFADATKPTRKTA